MATVWTEIAGDELRLPRRTSTRSPSPWSRPKASPRAARSGTATAARDRALARGRSLAHRLSSAGPAGSCTCRTSTRRASNTRHAGARQAGGLRRRLSRFLVVSEASLGGPERAARAARAHGPVPRQHRRDGAREPSRRTAGASSPWAARTAHGQALRTLPGHHDRPVHGEVTGPEPLATLAGVPRQQGVRRALRHERGDRAQRRRSGSATPSCPPSRRSATMAWTARRIQPAMKASATDRAPRIPAETPVNASQ